MSVSPVFILVHGGWHTPAHYRPFTDAVEARGYQIIAPSLPSTNSEIPADPTVEDTDTIAETARSLADAGKEVVIIAHSCGGIASSEAAHGLGVRERASKGLPGGVRNIVFVAAAVGEAGKTVHLAREMPTDPSRMLAFPDAEGKLLILSEGAEEKLYSGIDQSKHRELMSTLVTHPVACLGHVMEHPANKEVDLVFVYCEEDQCVSAEDQRWIVGELKKTGVEFREGSVPSGHFPFISMPEKLLDTILGLI